MCARTHKNPQKHWVLPKLPQSPAPFLPSQLICSELSQFIRSNRFSHCIWVPPQRAPHTTFVTKTFLQTKPSNGRVWIWELWNFCCSTIQHTPPGTRGFFYKVIHGENIWKALDQTPSVLVAFWWNPHHSIFEILHSLVVSKHWICSPRLPHSLLHLTHSSGSRFHSAFQTEDLIPLTPLAAFTEQETAPGIFCQNKEAKSTPAEQTVLEHLGKPSWTHGCVITAQGSLLMTIKQFAPLEAAGDSPAAACVHKPV